MQIFTARYSAQQLIIDSGAVPVRISVGNPRFPLRYKVLDSIKAFMPTYAMLKLDSAGYYKAYWANMEAAGGIAFAKAELERVAKTHGNDKLVLLCFEDLRDGTKECHRRELAKWLEANGLGPVPDLEPVGERQANPTPKPPKARKKVA